MRLLRCYIYGYLKVKPIITKWQICLPVHTSFTISKLSDCSEISHYIASGINIIVIFSKGKRCNEVNPMWGTNPWNKASQNTRNYMPYSFQIISVWILQHPLLTTGHWKLWRHGLRSKHFRGVWEQRKTEEQDFVFCSRRKCGEYQKRKMG